MRVTEVFVMFTAILLFGCSNGVVVDNMLVWGADVSFDKISQIPHGRAGVVSNNFVYTPTNKPSSEFETNLTNHGAVDCPAVLTENKVPSVWDMFTGGEPMISRVVVGEPAKNIYGVTFMMRDKNGNLDDNAIRALEAISQIQSYSDNRELLKVKNVLIKLYRNGKQQVRTFILKKLKSAGVDSFDKFVDGKPKELSESEIVAIIKSIK